MTEDAVSEAEPVTGEPEGAPPAEELAVLAPANDDMPSAEKPKKPRRAAKPKKVAAEAVAEIAGAETSAAEAASVASGETPAPVSQETEVAAAEETPKVRPSRRKPVPVDAPVVPVVSSIVPDEAKTEEAKAEDKPKRAGWWQRKGFF
ncbi:hypothetical protein [Mesorhizobium sp. M1405]